MSLTENQRAIDRLCVFALLASVATVMIASLYPSGDSLSGVIAYGWVWAQSLLMILPGCFCGITIAKFRGRLGSLIGFLMITAVPLLVLCDAITFSWMGERFLSQGVWRTLTLRESLVDHIAAGTVYFAAITSLTFVLTATVAWWFSAMLAAQSSTLFARGLLAGLVCLGIAFSVPVLCSQQEMRAEMAGQSARHPLCALGLFYDRSVGGNLRPVMAPMGGGEAMEMQNSIGKREARLSRLKAVPRSARSGKLPDVVMVVIESFRHELVDPEVMPALWQFAQAGIHCRKHFSTGNATTHGMFGLLNGMEAVWYSRLHRKPPVLNRLLRDAGYEIGFFASHDDWRKFSMDGFINRQQFDVFAVEQPNWLESDRRSTELASRFLGREDAADRKPRVALLYLYSTHADYHSYPQDRLDLPAADDRFVIPFAESAAPAVWNRYKNSARSIDRFLSAILSEDRIVIVTGDHGEAFLEDGTCGHGIRLSRYQNMTPAVIYCPGRAPRVIDRPTMHADLLPTLLSAAGLTPSDARAMDGIDLLAASDDLLANRLFLTRNYLDDDCALIGSELGDLFGYRCSIVFRDWTARALNPIDEAGNETESSSDGQQFLKRWIKQRFAANR